MSKKDHHGDKVLTAAVAPLLPTDKFVALLVSIGLTAKYAEGVAKNVKLANTFVTVCREAGVADTGCSAAVGALLNKVATSLLPEWELAIANRPRIVRYIVGGQIKTAPQMEKIVAYFKKATSFDVAEFEAFCGVGVEITAAQVAAEVQKQLDAATGGGCGGGWSLQFKLLPEINKALKFADGAVVMAELEKQLTARFGPKGSATATAAAADKKGGATDKKAPKDSGSAAAGSSGTAAAGSAAVVPGSAITEEDDFADSARDLKAAHNTEEQRQRHLAATKGVVYTRFPPEPNGYLHIGHAKSMRFNFGLAAKRGGHCIMRFDDTNPEAEKQEYIDAIHDSLRWLGHKPVKVTHTSDYFPHLYDLAVKLIRRGLAYVDHQTQEEIATARSTKEPSPWRDRPVADNLRLFEDMRKGKFEEGKATLRMKGDLTSPNPQMWDMVAYRIKYEPHPHTGNTWCIYPSYDYSHCIIDSLEWITHSLCTLEFEVRRESYFWLLDVLDMYKPKVWEFSRLNITNNVMSKRKLNTLVTDGHVKGWDDPRLFTISGLRRRGYTADAINDFCDKVGVSRTANTIEIQLLEACARQSLDPIARRAMVVVAPLRVVLTNYDATKVEHVDALTNPKEKTTHKVPFSRVLYIDRSDFKAEAKASDDFYGLTLAQPVRLKYAYMIRATGVTTDATGRVTEVQATVDLKDMTTKCKGNLHWVAQPQPGVDPTTVELRLYDRLFLEKDPAGLDDWLAHINPQSLETVVDAFASVGVAGARPGDKYQFERVGYFNTDEDSSADAKAGGSASGSGSSGRLVFNRTVKLKETGPKAGAAAAAAGSAAAAADTAASGAGKSASAKNKEKQAKKKGDDAKASK